MKPERAMQGEQIPKPSSEIVRAAIYARHSSSKQNPKSCEEQIEHIQYLLRKGEVKPRKYSGQIEVIPQWVIKDEAITGRNANRDGYQVILDALARKVRPFDLLILDDLSRANRDLGNTLDLYNRAQYSGVEIVSICDNLTSEDPGAKMHFTVKGMINDWSNEAHAMRTLRGMEAKVLKGLSCGDIPFGYKTVPTAHDREGHGRDFKIVPDPEKAKVVHRIFKMYAEGHGRAAICKALNSEKVPWPGYYSNPPVGRGWATSTIWRTLRNQKYIGIWSWKLTKYIINPNTGKKEQKKRPDHEHVSHHEGEKCREDLRIISQQLWNKVRKTFEDLDRDETHGIWKRFIPSVATHMLSGLLKCNKCGSSMVLITGQKGGFFGCGAANRTGTCTHKRLIKRTRLEKEITDYVRGLITDESSFEQAAKHYNRLMNDKLNYAKENLDKYESELAVIEIELKNLSDAISRAGSETLLKSLDEKEQRKRYLKHQIKQIKLGTAEKIYVTPGAMREKFKRLSNALRSKPSKAAIALQKVFPEGLKMQWNGGNWEIRGLIIMDSKGGTSEVELVVK